MEGTVKNKHLISRILQKLEFLKFYKKPQRWLRSLVLVSVFALLLFAFNPNPAAAANFYWIGGHTGTPNAWNDALNWSASSGGAGGAGIPGSSDSAIFDNGSAVNCTLSASAEVGSITNTNYAGILALSTYALTVNGDLTWNAGTISAGSSTITVAGNLNTSGSTFTYSTSTIVMTGTAKTITNGSTAYYNLTISGTIATASTTLTINNNLTVDADKSLSIGSGLKVTLASASTLTLNGAIDGDGTLYFSGWSSKTLPATGTININVEIIGSSITIPGRNFGANLKINHVGISNTNTNLTLGSAPGQTINIAGNFETANSNFNTSTITLDASVNNPYINFGGDFNSSSYYAKTTIRMGSGMWKVSGDNSFAGHIYAGTSTLVMDGDHKVLNVHDNNGAPVLYNVQFKQYTNLSENSFTMGVSHELIVDQNATFYLETTVDTNILAGATIDNSGLIDSSDGIFRITDNTGDPFIGNGTYDVQINFYSSTTDSVIPARSYNRVLVEDNAAVPHSVILGTAPGQTISFVSINMRTRGSSNLTVDASVNNPDINVTDDVDLYHLSTGLSKIKMGSGHWTVGPKVSLSNANIDHQTSTVSIINPNRPTWTVLGNSNYQDYHEEIRSSAVYNNDLYVGGQFTKMNDLTVNYIAKWDGNSWSALGDGADYDVDALTTFDNKLIIGGWVTGSSDHSGCVGSWDGNDLTAMDNGLDDNCWVNALKEINGELYAGGWFPNLNTAVVKWNGSSWAAVGSLQRVMGSDGVLALEGFNGKIIAGGVLGGGTQGFFLSQWDGSNWTPLGGDTDSYVNALLTYDGKLYVGGWFGTAGGVTSAYVANWNGSNWSSMNLGTDFDFFKPQRVQALTVFDNKIVAAGYLSKEYGDLTNSIAYWNGSGWVDMNNKYFAYDTMTVYDNDLVVGGFGEYGIGPVPLFGYSLNSEDITLTPTPTPTPTPGGEETPTPTADPDLTSTPAPTVSSTTGVASTSRVLSDILPATGKSTPDRSHNLFHQIELFILEKITLLLYY